MNTTTNTIHISHTNVADIVRDAGLECTSDEFVAAFTEAADELGVGIVWLGEGESHWPADEQAEQAEVATFDLIEAAAITTMSTITDLTDVLVVTHLHDDGNPAAGQTIDAAGELHPWRDLGSKTIDDVTRVVDESGRPAYLVDFDDGRRLDTAFANINEALAGAIEAGR